MSKQSIKRTGRERCPKCDSPQPRLHPAVQFEGEVSICPDPFHGDKVPKKAGGIGGYQLSESRAQRSNHVI